MSEHSEATFASRRVANIEERAAILASGVGVARLKLRDGDAEGALAALDDAAAKTRALIRDAQSETAKAWADREYVEPPFTGDSRV